MVDFLGEKMNILTLVDGALLQGASRVAKSFNWLTGKDNFALAKLLNWASICPTIMVLVAAASLLSQNALGVAAVMFVWSSATYYIIRYVVDGKIKEQRDGAKDIGLEFSLRIARVLTLIFFLTTAAFMQIVSVYVPGDNPAIPPWVINFIGRMVVISIALCVSSLYVVSVDRPPFSKSRAWELFKSLFTVRELAPARVRSS